MTLREKIKSIQFLRALVIRYRNIRGRYSFILGKNNSIIKNGIAVNSKIQLVGNANQLVLEKESILLNAHIQVIGNNNHITIKNCTYLEGTQLFIEDNNCTVFIGERTFIGPSHIAITEDGSSLTIGNDCMISSHVQIRTGDSHSILDENGNRINRAQPISIANNVWLGEGCRIMKGVSLAEHVVVSTGSVVTKSFDSHKLIGGIPAKILKGAISWNPIRI